MKRTRQSKPVQMYSFLLDGERKYRVGTVDAAEGIVNYQENGKTHTADAFCLMHEPIPVYWCNSIQRFVTIPE